MKSKWITIAGFVAGIAISMSAYAFLPPESDNFEISSWAAAIYSDPTDPLRDAATILGVGAADWSGRRSAGPELKFRASGQPFIIGGPLPDAAAAYQALTAYAVSRKSSWGNSSDFNLAPLHAWQYRGIWHLAMQQTSNGIPVYGSRLDGKLTDDGRLCALSVRLFPSADLNSAFALTQQQALRLLTPESSATIENLQQVYFPLMADHIIELRPAWLLRALTDQTDLRPEGIVDAATGEVLLRYNDVNNSDVWGNVLGLVLPAYSDDLPQAWPQKHQWVNVVGGGIVYTDTLGDYLRSGLSSGAYPIEGQLYGLYVDVNNDDGPDAFYADTATTAAPLDWTWDYDMARQDEINVYYHTDLVHDYFKALDEDFTDLDFPLPATVAYGTNYANAFWNGSGMFFGTGGMQYGNFALFCDVIYHEYGHGVTDKIYPSNMLPYTGQPGAMNEGWSDYFACTITDEPLIGEGGLMPSGLPMRNLDNTLVFPQNWSGEVHADGRIFAGALWDLRERVGAGTADTIIHFARYALAEMWEDYFVDVLVTDDEDGDLTNGGPHHPEIYESFALHGIGPGLEPILAISLTEVLENGSGGSQGNGDGFYDPGEVLSMTFSVTDLRYLYPPPATDVTVEVSSDNPHLSMEPQSFSLGSVAPGATVQAPESLLITVSAQAPLSYAQLIFQISANGGAYQISDSLEITIGHPAILLVDDDAGASYQQFPYAALRTCGQVFSLYGVAQQGEISPAVMNDYQVLIWMTGNDSLTTLTESDQVNLGDFLDGGGNLLLTGQNLVEDIGESDFFSDYLKCDPLAGDINGYTLDGVSGDPISDSTWLIIVGAVAAGNQNSPAAISALPGAVEIYHYQTDPDHRPAAVRYDAGTYKVVTLAFGCEAVSGLGGSTSQGNMLAAVLNWFGLPTAVEAFPPAATLPGDFDLERPFPNPFNATVALGYLLPSSGYVSLKVYDLAGRSVATLVNGWQQAGRHELTIKAADLPSGIYFARFQAGGYVEMQKLVLLK